MSLSGKDGNDMLKLVEQQDDIRVARVLRTVWDDDNDDSYLWSVNGCYCCQKDLHEGDLGYVWGKPINNERDCQLLVMQAYCGDECIERAMEAWAAELKVDVMTGYFGNFENNAPE